MCENGILIAGYHQAELECALHSKCEHTHRERPREGGTRARAIALLEPDPTWVDVREVRFTSHLSLELNRVQRTREALPVNAWLVHRNGLGLIVEPGRGEVVAALGTTFEGEIEAWLADPSGHPRAAQDVICANALARLCSD